MIDNNIDIIKEKINIQRESLINWKKELKNELQKKLKKKRI